MPGPMPIMVKAFAPHAVFDPGRPSIGVASSTPSALGSTRRGRMPKNSGSPGAWSGCSRGRSSPPDFCSLARSFFARLPRPAGFFFVKFLRLYTPLYGWV